MPTSIATFRSQIDSVVRSLDHIEVVFDNQQRTAGVNQRSKRRQKFVGVVEVQAGGWLVEDVESHWARGSSIVVSRAKIR